MTGRDFKKYKIGIIGLGFVGGAMRRYFESAGANLFLYDKYKKIGSPAEVNKADIIFIAVPTPYGGRRGFNLDFVRDAVGILTGSKIVVIKSSVLPGTTDALQKKHPQHKIMFNPEFLREASAYEDLIKPDRQIIGVTKKSRGAAEEVMDILPDAPYRKIMPVKEAEMIKYMANSFLALKVVFANEFGDLCEKLGTDYDLVREGVARDSRIGSSHLDILHGGYRGYGGSCFPKDINALIQFVDKQGIEMALLKKARQINRKLLKESGLSENYFLKFLHRKKS